MSISIYKTINSLLQVTGTGVTSQTDEFNIRQIRVNNGTKIKNTKPHRTGFYGLTFIEGGVGKIHINNESYEFKDNMLITTSPGQIITLEVKSVTNGYVLFFMSEFLNFPKPETIESQFPFFKLNAEMIGAIKDEDDMTYKTLFRNINIEYYRREPEHLNIIRGYLLALLGLTSRHFLKTNGKINKAGRKYDLTAEFEKLVLENIPEHKSITQLSAKLSISPKHLNEIIKETTGGTTSAFITHLFMLEAKKLLLYSNLSISEIAYKLNFSDPSYFNKVFKKQFQVTPLEFRNQVR
jgi:AraC family transcriptional regulator, transcriptional activator of pobA